MTEAFIKKNHKLGVEGMELILSFSASFPFYIEFLLGNPSNTWPKLNILCTFNLGRVSTGLQKQSLRAVLWKNVFQKFCKIHKKALVPESLV